MSRGWRNGASGRFLKKVISASLRILSLPFAFFRPLRFLRYLCVLSPPSRPFATFASFRSLCVLAPPCAST